jgi:hypothetical protein
MNRGFGHRVVDVLVFLRKCLDDLEQPARVRKVENNLMHET